MMTLEKIIDSLRHRANGLYGGEPVTQLEHALQCASLAQGQGAAGELVVAALLHDIHHLVEGADDEEQPHDKMGAQMLSALFGSAVTEPIRLHVDAKRYLCAVEPQYRTGLSEMSKRSLMWQGGPFSAEQAAAFIRQPYAKDAVRLRRWDDAAKVVGQVTPALEEFIPIIRPLVQENSFGAGMDTDKTPDIVVREAGPDDADTLAALMTEMDDEPEMRMDADQMRKLMAGMAAYPDFRAYLALSHTGAPVGTFTLMMFSSPSHHGARQAMLDAVVVTRSSRGQGVGGAMLRHALNIASRSGCYKMTLSSNLKRVDAHRFYEDLGFRQHGISFCIHL